jgi:hypothetical protein
VGAGLSHPFAGVSLGLSRLVWGLGAFFLPLSFLVRLSGLLGHGVLIVAAMGHVDARTSQGCLSVLLGLLM